MRLVRQVWWRAACSIGLALLLAAPAAAARAQDAPDDGPAIASARVEQLMRDAARAVDAHEKARAAVEHAEAELARIGHRQSAEQRRLDRLTTDMGLQASREYRSGSVWGPVVPMLLADSLQQALDGALLVRRGDRAVTQLGEQVRRSRDLIAADRVRSALLLDGLRVQAARRVAARKEVETKLDQAREELKRVQELARKRAEEQARARAEEAARAAAGSLPAGSGDCAHGDVGEYAEPAGREAWVAPVTPAPLSAGFGAGGERWAHRHTGQDFAVGTGTPVRAVGAGTVVFAGCGDGFGNQVIVRHPDGYFTQYAHLSLIGVSTGDRVGTGQPLGLSGATGNASGPHLHFEVRITPQLGSGIDPLPWLRARGVRVGAPLPHGHGE